MLREELLVIIDGGWWPVPRRTTRRVLQHDKALQNRDVDHVTHRHNLFCFLSHIYADRGVVQYLISQCRTVSPYHTYVYRVTA